MLFVNLNAKMGIHQSALADAMYEILGEDFKFVEFGQKGFQYGSFTGPDKNTNFERPYIIRMWESEEEKKQGLKLIEQADVIRTGGEPRELTLDRIKGGKLTFRSTERIMKGPLYKDVFRTRALLPYLKYANPNYRVLCQSAFMANDLSLIGNLYRERCYKFAYFTQIPDIDIEKVLEGRNKEKIQIVWCARFIDFKHPELPLALAKRLLESGRKNFEIRMIGANTTPLWLEIDRQVKKENLENHVILTGGIPNTDVLERMRKSHIFIFTSDRGEGWGAVLNEAMGAGCACVASNEIGSVPFLLKHKENGLIFKSCSVNSLFENVVQLYDSPELCQEYGRKAYQTITTKWSAYQAAERLVRLSESILDGNEISFADGPCSKAYSCKPNSII